MRLGITSLVLGGAWVAGYPLTTGQNKTVGPVSPDILHDIYTYAAFTRAAYCMANYDGAIGNLVCSNSASAHACDVFGGAATAVEFIDSAAAGNIVVSHERALVVVSFRGTDRWADVWRDLQVQLVDAPALCANCTVHQGYWDAFLDVIDGLEGVLFGDAALAGPAYRVVLAGHSMGGALAAVAAAYLRRRGRACDLFTYGAPRVGNQALASLIDGGPGGATAHVVNRKDVIASQPPLFMGYASVVPEYWFEAGIESPAFPDNLRVCDGVEKKSEECSAAARGWIPAFTGGVSDHSIDAYSNRSMPCPGG